MTPTRAAARRRRTTLAVVLAAAVAAFVCCAALDLAVTPDERAAAPVALGLGWSTALPGLVVAALGVLVLDRARARRMGALLVGYGWFLLVDGLAESWTAFGSRGAVALPGTTAALWFFDRCGAFLPVGVPLLLLLYPTGRFLPGRWGSAGRVSLALMLLGPTAYVLAPARDPLPGRAVPSGLDLAWSALPVPPELAARVTTPVYAVAFAAAAVAVVTVGVRHRRARGRDRSQMRWLLWAALVVVLLSLTTLVLQGSELTLLVGALLFLVPSAAVTIGLVRPELGAVDELLTRTLVYGLLTLLVLAVDVAVLSLLDRTLGNALDQRSVVLLVLVVSLLVYAPLRSRALGWGRRLLLGRRDDPYGVVAGLAASLERVDDPAAQLREIAAAVARAFRVSFVSVEVDRSRGERLVAMHGRRPAEVRSLPVGYRDAEVGRLVLPARGLSASLSRRDEALLGDLVRQAAVAARTARLADDLQDSREQLVLAREEERRRVRRDLHDGLGPALAGVLFRLESARLQVPQDPDAAVDSLTTARDQVRDVVSDVRRLVHDLRPPALDDLGLVEALGRQAEHLSGPTLTVQVSGDLPGRLPAGVEVAAFRIAGEAMANAARHAGARHCRVALELAAGELVVEVCDDGRGVPADAPAGVGLVSLRERAAELGGRTEVVCPVDGGTRVRAWLPVRSTE